MVKFTGHTNTNISTIISMVLFITLSVPNALSQVCTLTSGPVANANVNKCIVNVCPNDCSVSKGSTIVEVKIPDGTKVELADDWDLSDYKVNLNLIGENSQLSFPGSGGSAKDLTMNTASYIQVDPANNGGINDADGLMGLVASNGGNVRINIGSTSYSGNQFASSIIDSGGINVGAISTPLPIKLLHFNATKINSKVIVEWKTAMELNNDYFKVERSEDGINFYSIGDVAGSSNSQQTIEYSFSDDYLPNTAILYYRLTQYDLDGNFESFDIVAIENSGLQESAIVYPNPVNSQTRIFSPRNEVDTKFDYEIINNYGKIIASGNSSWSESLKLESLQAGVYRLSINHTDIIKLVKN